MEDIETDKKIILEKLYAILKINNNNMIALKDLDKNKEQQEAILNLTQDAKKCFNYKDWTYFRNKKRVIKRIYLSVMKSILKEMDIEIIITAVRNKNTNKNETFYIIKNK